MCEALKRFMDVMAGWEQGNQVVFSVMAFMCLIVTLLAISTLPVYVFRLFVFHLTVCLRGWPKKQESDESQYKMPTDE